MNEKQPTGVLVRVRDFDDYDEYIRIFGGADVPITRWTPHQALAEDKGVLLDFYQVDLGRLTIPQIEQLLDHLATRWKADLAEVAIEIQRTGLGIRAERLAVEIPMKFFC